MDAKGLISSPCKRVDIVSSKELRWCVTKPICWNDNMFYCLKLNNPCTEAILKRNIILQLYYIRITKYTVSHHPILIFQMLCHFVRQGGKAFNQPNKTNTTSNSQLSLSNSSFQLLEASLHLLCLELQDQPWSGVKIKYMWNQPPPTVDVSGQIIRFFSTNLDFQQITGNFPSKTLAFEVRSL